VNGNICEHPQLKLYIGIGIAPGRRHPVVFVGTSKVALFQAMLDILNSLRLFTMPSMAESPTVSASIVAIDYGKQ